MNPNNKKGRDIQRLGSLRIKNAAILVANARHRFYFVSFYSLLYLLLAILTIPTFFLIGCTRNDAQAGLINLTTNLSIADDNCLNTGTIHALDIYVFNNDKYKRLDSYQRIDCPDINDVVVTSRTGEKLVVMIANLPDNISHNNIVNSYEGLCRSNAELSYEDPIKPIMCGEAVFTAGEGNTISLSPLMSVIEIRSIKCDFTSQSLSGIKLENVRAYLTNVRNLYPLAGGRKTSANSLINMFELSANDFKDFSNPNIIIESYSKPIGSMAADTTIRLFCYSNMTKDFSSPQTSLVLEGQILGQTYYYPIAIDNGYGVERNMVYSYDITITQKGAASPESPISSSQANINYTNTIWNIKEPVHITL